MGVDVDFDDNICDEVTDMMYCTLTADGARPSDKLLSVFSIDKDGKVDYYPKHCLRLADCVCRLCHRKIHYARLAVHQ